MMKSINCNHAEEAQEAYAQAEAFYTAEQYTESVEWYQKAIESGCVQALYDLGICYLHGLGVEQDDDQAASLFRRAMAEGNVHAAAMLSRLCAVFGYDMPVEELFQAAKMGAEAGCVYAFAPLADCYYYGLGCCRNVKLAAYWACRSYAYREDVSEAYELMGRYYQDGYYVPKVPAMSKYCYRKAEELGYDAAWILAEPEFEKIKPIEPYIPVFDDQSADFFTEPCPLSQYLEALDYLGRGDRCIPVDAQKAEALLVQAASQGLAAAQYELGLKYIDTGQTDIKYDRDGSIYAFHANEQLGLSLLRKAADQGFYDALEGICFIASEHEDIGFEECMEYEQLREQLFQGHDLSYRVPVAANPKIMELLNEIVKNSTPDCLLDGNQLCNKLNSLYPQERTLRRRIRMAYASGAVSILINEKEYAICEAIKCMMDYTDMSNRAAKSTILALYEVFKQHPSLLSGG